MLSLENVPTMGGEDNNNILLLSLQVMYVDELVLAKAFQLL